MISLQTGPVPFPTEPFLKFPFLEVIQALLDVKAPVSKPAYMEGLETEATSHLFPTNPTLASSVDGRGFIQVESSKTTSLISAGYVRYSLNLHP